MEGVCNTSLCLGFGSQIQYKNADMKKFCGCVGKDHQDSHSDTQLFCKMGVKKEQDLGSEEIEVKSVHGHDRQEVGARKKLRLSKEQAVILEESFKKHSILNKKHKQALVKQLNVSPRQLEVWFQNRRARTKFKQMEVDAEYLKKFCETLKNENKILQKELDDLKASNVAPELRMQHTAATISLTMCPSCEYGSH